LLPDLAAVTAAYRKRQPQRSLPLSDDAGERQHCSAVTPQAVGVQFMLVFVESREGAEVDHGTSIGSSQAQGVSRIG